jgi:hypothetical protein
MTIPLRAVEIAITAALAAWRSNADLFGRLTLESLRRYVVLPYNHWGFTRLTGARIAPSLET